MRKNNKWLITTTMITLTLFNVRSAQAENNSEISEENSAIEQNQSKPIENTVNSNDSVESLSSGTLIEFNEIIESIITYLDADQKQRLDEFLLEENEITALFKETVIIHEEAQYDLAIEQYQILLGKLSDENNIFIISLVEAFQNAAREEQSLLDTKFIVNKPTVETEKKEEQPETDATDQMTELEELGEESKKVETPEVEDTEQKVQQNRKAVNLSIKSTQKTAEDLYNQILNAKGVSGAWSLAEEFKATFPNHALLEEAINYAAKVNLDYGVRIHERADYEEAAFYYNRVINETLTAESLKAKAHAYLKKSAISQIMLTPTEYYNQITNAKSISGAYNLVEEFKAVYPDDALLPHAVDYVAELNLNYGMKLHERGEYTDAISYYERISNDSIVSESLRNIVNIYLKQANSNREIMTPEDYSNEILNAKSVTGAWNLAQEFKNLFPNNSLLDEPMNHAAQLNLNYGKKLHTNGDFINAASYYNKIVNEQMVSTILKSEAQAYLNQANTNQKLTTPADYYTNILNAKGVSGAWNLAQEFKANFPNASSLKEAMNHAAQLNLNYGMKIHADGDTANGIFYYNRVLGEEIVSDKLKSEAQVYLNQADANQSLRTPKDYYEQILNAKGVTGAWNLANELISNFPHDKFSQKGFDYAAQLYINYGMKLHRAGDYVNARDYYNLLTETPYVSTTVKNHAKAFQRQANAKQNLTTADNYYSQIQSSKLVSSAWSLAQNFKTDFPSDVRLGTAMNIAAEMNLNYAIKLHGQGNFSAAAEYYTRIFNEEHVGSSIKIKAELYNYLAANNLHIGEMVVNNSKYNMSLNQAINTQMALGAKPQVSAIGGGFRNATRDEVAYYINPINFLPTASNSLMEALSTVQITVGTLNVRSGPSTLYNQIGTVHNGEVFTIIDIKNGWYQISKNGNTGWISGSQNYVYRNNEILQFLDLSVPMGLPVTELNNYLNSYGILSGEGEAFSKASQSTRVNELYLISHALLETGNGTSSLATGILVTEINDQKVEPKVVYNMFGIGAYDSNPNKFGSERAYQEGWFTPEAAIIGGAKWVAENYIHNPHYQQKTLYEMRWNPSTPGTHQYATDVGWAIKQTNRNIK